MVRSLRSWRQVSLCKFLSQLPETLNNTEEARPEQGDRPAGLLKRLRCLRRGMYDMVVLESMAKQTHPFSFPKQERIRKKRDFQVLLSRGKYFQAEGVRFRYLPNGLPWSRLGLAVSRKCGKACKRNKIRRLLREGYRLTKGSFPYSVDVLAAPLPGEELTFAKARAAFEALASHLQRKRQEVP